MRKEAKNQENRMLYATSLDILLFEGTPDFHVLIIRFTVVSLNKFRIISKGREAYNKNSLSAGSCLSVADTGGGTSSARQAFFDYR